MSLYLPSRELFIFGLVGILATITHYFTALLFHDLLYTPLWLANLLGYLCAVPVSYKGHRIFTFRIQHSKDLLLRFIIISTATFTLSELILIVLEENYNWPAQNSLLIIVFSIPVLSYFLNRIYVFKETANK